MATTLEKIAGQGGFKLVTGTGAQTGLNVNSIVVNEDCVFTAFVINGVDAMTTKNLTGNTIAAGMYLPCDENHQITAFTLASGSVITYQ